MIEVEFDFIIATTVLSALGPLAFILLIIVTAFQKNPLKPSANNRTQILQYFFFENKDTIKNENCQKGQQASASFMKFKTSSNCTFVYGADVLAMRLSIDSFSDAVLSI